jgi:3-oxoacyl-[acyl-carrier protein] reductase
MRVAITGASSGIGLATAKRLAAAGHQVWAFGHRARPLIEHPNVIVDQIDVSAPDEVVAERIRTLVDRWGTLQVWINNAGADILSPPLSEGSWLARWRALSAVDVEGTIRCSKAVAPYLSDGGQILNTAWDHWQVGRRGVEGELYAAAKAAVVGFSRSYARTLQAQGRAISVNVIAPGWVKTRWGSSLSPSAQKRVVHTTFQQRWLEPQELAEAILRIVELPTGLFNGHIFWLNGGDVMG